MVFSVRGWSSWTERAEMCTDAAWKQLHSLIRDLRQDCAASATECFCKGGCFLAFHWLLNSWACRPLIGQPSSVLLMLPGCRVSTILLHRHDPSSAWISSAQSREAEAASQSFSPPLCCHPARQLVSPSLAFSMQGMLPLATLSWLQMTTEEGGVMLHFIFALITLQLSNTSCTHLGDSSFKLWPSRWCKTLEMNTYYL